MRGESGGETIFFNREGLRPGWGMVVFLLLATLLSAVMVTAMTPMRRGPHAVTAGYLGQSSAMTCVAVVGAGMLMSLIERRRFTAYGLSRVKVLPMLVSGLVCGLVFLSALIGALHWSGHLEFGPAALSGRAAVARGAGWLVAFGLVGLQEEFATRGYLQYTLARGIAGVLRWAGRGGGGADRDEVKTEATAFWLAALVLSAGLFMVLHLGNAGENGVGILAVGMAGMTFAFSLWRTGGLWWAIGFHATWDWAQSFLFGVADSGTRVVNHLMTARAVGAPLLSGGEVGPEGSVLVFPTLLLVCLLIHVVYPRRAGVGAVGVGSQLHSNEPHEPT